MWARAHACLIRAYSACMHICVVMGVYLLTETFHRKDQY